MATSDRFNSPPKGPKAKGSYTRNYTFSAPSTFDWSTTTSSTVQFWSGSTGHNHTSDYTWTNLSNPSPSQEKVLDAARLLYLKWGSNRALEPVLRDLLQAVAELAAEEEDDLDAFRHTRKALVRLERELATQGA